MPPRGLIGSSTSRLFACIGIGAEGRTSVRTSFHQRLAAVLLLRTTKP
jgi:hypothetical protein